MSKNKELWIVGKFNDVKTTSWKLIGVFSTEPIAIEACEDCNYFISPVIVNDIGFESDELSTGAYFPIKGIKLDVEHPEASKRLAKIRLSKQTFIHGIKKLLTKTKKQMIVSLTTNKELNNES